MATRKISVYIKWIWSWATKKGVKKIKKKRKKMIKKKTASENDDRERR